MWFTGGVGSNIQGAAGGRGESKADVAAARRQRYGKYGSPWGDVPAALEDHLRRRTGYSGSALRYFAGAEELPPGMGQPPLAIGNPDSAMQLIEESPGKFVWTGWEDDPQYLAYKEQQAGSRQAVARERTQAQSPHAGPMTVGTGGYGQLEQLFAAQEMPAQREPTLMGEY